MLRNRLQLRNKKELVEQDRGSQSYYILLCISALIATLGVLIDNATVIIGAMLIAPLMVPIMALAVSVARGEAENIINSLGNLSMSILVVVLLAFLTSKVVPVVEIPEQALLRAQPNIVDLLIAIASGAVGMYAYLHRDVPESLVGVAIAVSLVPPLTVVGLGFGLGAFLLSLGATVLFFTNVVAILCAAVVVLFLHGKSAQDSRSEEKRDVALASSGITLAIAVILGVLLSGAFVQVYREEQRKAIVRETLTPLVEEVGGTITELETTLGSGQVAVDAIVRVPDNVEELDVQRMNNALVYALENSVDLQVSLIRIQQATRELEADEQQKIQEIKSKTQTESLQELEGSSAGEGELMEVLDATHSGEVETEKASESAEPAPESTDSAEPVILERE
ncbi:TIGR00341 family protein [Candidatus Woesebacteria bacterium]|nr:TIGR00341 family protein [Candidatus Woesebacteria bacterium]MCD8507402.1 TIGR00341 family protein [Candidatus Woesebacteria bacterium]MCD8527342.1 TIGR00341 family protein [Candidatus Woesebacteria bacterium]MCD8546089.1 TIGR00341 family protein [Candidatus Woesebacteria bacterium]